MVDVKLTSDKGSMAQRVSDRLKPSAGKGSGDVQVTLGSSPNRTVTTIHHSRVKAHQEREGRKS